MSIWSLLLACQGSYYNGPENILGFDPMWQPDNHASFFTGADGWGLFEQKRSNDSQKDIIKVAYGQLNVQGPKSRELLQSLTSVDLSNEAFPFRAVKEIDINPLIVSGSKPIAVDALVVLGEGESA